MSEAFSRNLPGELVQAKRALRKSAHQNRQALAERLGATAGPAALEHLLASRWLAPGATVSAYWPMPGEFDVRPILHALSRRGHPCVLPVVVTKGQALAFRVWRPDSVLVFEGFGVLTPPASAPERRPDLLLVPLLAFDAAGFRLGYGGGYYDRTLEMLRADGRPRPLAVGIAFSGQEVAAVPHGPRDQRLDALASEAGLRSFAAEGRAG
jgi:5-formyltetrahydrofolate cyclo-ligase